MINVGFSQLNNKNSIAFTGLKENLALGQQVLKGFRAEYPMIQSNTYIAAKITQNENIAPSVIQNLWDLATRQNQKIKAARQEFYANNYFNFDSFIESLKKVIKKHKCENCESQADIIQYELLKKEEKPHKVFIHLRDENLEDIKKRKYHIFTVFGMKNGAQLENPRTWGNNAVVVDSWANIVMPAREAIEYFKNFFKFDGQRHSLEFGSRDRFLID